MKIVNQLTYPNVSYVTMQSFEEENLREEGKHTTVANSGCGLCSSVMVAHRLIANCNFELNDAIKLSYEIKANAYRGTNYKIYAPAFAEKLNLKLETTNDTERVRYCLKTGGTVVAHVGWLRNVLKFVFFDDFNTAKVCIYNCAVIVLEFKNDVWRLHSLINI